MTNKFDLIYQLFFYSILFLYYNRMSSTTTTKKKGKKNINIKKKIKTSKEVTAENTFQNLKQNNDPILFENSSFKWNVQIQQSNF